MRVFVGMSGGVDSSVTAALLLEQGHTVTGVYMKNWTQDLPGMRCPWAADLADAKRVAVQLGIDFEVFDFEKDYRQKVVSYMIDQYQQGYTPNPDIMCNQEVKFKLFLTTALERGADMIATGHYARTQNGRLLLAEDENKDQTYFLHRVKSTALQKTLFPLGNFLKPEVRELAQKFNLYTADKKESMGICFVGKVGIEDFLCQYVKSTPGDIIDQQSGKVIAKHSGAIFYTIGQRHGLNIGGGLPYYVVGKNISKNEIYVSINLNDDSFWRHELNLTSLHWIKDTADEQTKYKVRLRHRAPLVDCKIKFDSRQQAKIVLSEPQRIVAPGQSAVIYKDQVCLGGGIII